MNKKPDSCVYPRKDVGSGKLCANSEESGSSCSIFVLGVCEVVFLCSSPYDGGGHCIHTEHPDVSASHTEALVPFSLLFLGRCSSPHARAFPFRPFSSSGSLKLGAAVSQSAEASLWREEHQIGFL